MAEKLVQMDLTGIELSNPTTRMLSTEGFSNFVQEDDIDTAVGNTRVIVQGDRKKPAIITMHDIGLNSSTCFQGFFNYPDMQPILRHFCVYHMNCPGQQEGSLPLPQGSGLRHSESETLLSNIGKDKEKSGPAAIAKQLGKRASDFVRSYRSSSLAFTGDPSAAKTYTYPTMDQLAEMILPVMQFYGLKTFIGFGVGSGANILSRFSMMHADRIEALVLINCVSGKAGWTEWGYQKVNTWHLKGGTMSTSVEDYLLWHWFGKRTADTSHDLVRAYTDHIKAINPQNLAHFIDSYVKRTDLCLVKETDPIKKKSVRNIKCPVLLVAGDFSAHLDDTVTMNSRLDPGETQFIKFHCGGMVLEEMPEKLCESFRLFLQGMGYVPNMSQTQLVETKARKRASLVNGSERTPIYTAPVHPPVPQQTHPKAAVDVTMC